MKYLQRKFSIYVSEKKSDSVNCIAKLTACKTVLEEYKMRRGTNFEKVLSNLSFSFALPSPEDLSYRTKTCCSVEPQY
jgi:hypothetical protein